MLPDSVDFVPVAEVDFGEFTAAFNRAYRDYFVPIVMSVASFRALIERDDISVEASVAAVQEGRIVGMGLLGIRGREGWIGGMGVIPSHRRHGIGRALMERLLARARDRELALVRLEVIEQNHPALTLYRAVGFSEIRRLLVLQRAPGTPVPAAPGGLTVSPEPVEPLLAHYDAFHRVRNSWQRARQSLASLAPQLAGWSIHHGERLVGFGVGWISRGEVRLADLGVHPETDPPAVAAALLAHLHREHPEAYGAHYNVAEEDPTLPAYHAARYEARLVQFEMEWRADEV